MKFFKTEAETNKNFQNAMTELMKVSREEVKSGKPSVFPAAKGVAEYLAKESPAQTPAGQPVTPAAPTLGM